MTDIDALLKGIADGGNPRFAEFVRIVLAEEGVFSNDPSDPGGETWYGIARAAHPNIPWPPTVAEAVEIYRHQYWQPVMADDLPPPLDIAVADCAVNQGVAVAIRILQASIGAPVDGEIGPKTMAAIRAADARTVTPDYFARRCVVYSGLGNFDRYGHGWFARCFRLAMKLGAP